MISYHTGGGDLTSMCGNQACPEQSRPQLGLSARSSVNPGVSQAPTAAMPLYLLQKDPNSLLMDPKGTLTFTGAQVFAPSPMGLL